MNSNHWSANGVSVRALPLFLLAVLAWLAPQAAHHPKAFAAGSSIQSRPPVLAVARTCNRSTDLPPLLEEEEESTYKIERPSAGPSSGAAPALSPSRTALPESFALPIESRFESSTMPRGPPARSF